MNTVVTLGGLVVALVGFEATSRLQSWLDRPVVGLESHAWKVIVPVAVVGYVLGVEGESLASIGWTFAGPVPFALHAAAGLAALFAPIVLLAPVREPVSSDDLSGNDDLSEAMADYATFSVPRRLFVAGTAGVTEEVPYRGYVIERVATLTGSPLLGAAVSLVAFLAAHVSDQWSSRDVLGMAYPSLVLVALYLWAHSLPVVIVVHASWNAYALLMADRIAEQQAKAPA